MKAAGPESPFYKKVENTNPDPRPAPTAHRPPIEVNFANTEEMVEYAIYQTKIWEPDEQGSITQYACKTQSEIAELGTLTWPETILLARNGWPDGRKLLTTARSQYISFERTRVKAIGYDVGGAFPDVPRFLAGDPEHMIDLGESSRKARPVIRVVVSPMCPITVSAEARANWGAALLSWVTAEELAGNHVEIDVIYVTKAPAYYQEEYKWGPPVIVRYSLQKTNSYKSIDQLAFWLMHPAAHRRIQFAIREKLDIGSWYKYFQIYGSAVTERTDVQKFADKDGLLLILGDGASSVHTALASIEAEVEKWKERQFQKGNAAHV